MKIVLPGVARGGGRADARNFLFNFPGNVTFHGERDFPRELNSHNLGHELQIEAEAQGSPAAMKRTAKWVFKSLGTLRRNIIQPVGRISRPQGKLTITLPDIPGLRSGILRCT